MTPKKTRPSTIAPVTYAHATAVALFAAAEVITAPSPFCGPPKYSATSAEITARLEATFSPVNR